MSLTTDIVGIRALWRRTLGDPRVKIAILDGPVDLSHPTLSGARLDYLYEQHLPPDQSAFTHGTHIASLIFGQHAGRVKGIAPGCTGLVVPIFDTAFVCSQATLGHAITRAVMAGAQIINVSAGQFSESGEAHPLLAEAIRLCSDSGAQIISAVGNDGCACANVPSASPTVLAIGASDVQGQPLAFSNWSRLYSKHGLLAPGDELLGAGAGNTLQYASGTSQATAVVSGIVALLLSLSISKGATAREIAQLLLDSSSKCSDSDDQSACARFLTGRLNLPAACDKVFLMEEEVVPPAQDAGPQSGHPNIDPEVAVKPSGCGCGCGGNTQAPLVYALGVIDYDLATEARRDSIAQKMNPGTSPENGTELIAYLKEHPFDAASVIWTLNQDSTPIYAIQPQGPFAKDCYLLLMDFYQQQSKEGVERVSVPGRLNGTVRLSSGFSVPSLLPEIRGMYSWSTQALVKAAISQTKGASKEKADAIRNFLERVYFDLRNLGLTPQDRAINFSATNAFAAAQVFESALQAQMQLDQIGIERSPICRPESDCWDVKLIFFDPNKQLERARQVYRFTVDVSDVVPVTIGTVRSWAIR